MILDIPPSSGASYQTLPSGTYTGICINIIDLGTQENNFDKNNIKYNKNIRIRWETPLETFDIEKDGEKKEIPFTVSMDYTLSLSDKAKFRKHLEGWRGKAFSDDELSSFDTSKILGKACTLTVLTKDEGFPKITGVSGVMKGILVGTPQNDIFEFSIENSSKEDFEKLNKFDKNSIRKSPEGQKFAEDIFEEVSKIQEKESNDSDITIEDLPF